jgi:hypothetical protein
MLLPPPPPPPLPLPPPTLPVPTPLELLFVLRTDEPVPGRTLAVITRRKSMLLRAATDDESLLCALAVMAIAMCVHIPPRDSSMHSSSAKSARRT